MYWISTFILWDLVFTGVCVGMISLYSFAGVPSDCGGLTRENCKLSTPIHFKIS